MLSVVILTYQRRDAVLRTLERLAEQGIPSPPSSPAPDASEVILVDNASTDGTINAVADRFPAVRLLPLPRNVGVDAFNQGVALAQGDTLLILDDDAWPDPDSLRHARDLLRARPQVAAVALVPKHPATLRVEWPLAVEPRRDWPFMGCGNLIRTHAWRQARGYEPAYFLYRNDTDLALCLLALGHEVVVRPDWTVWHDTPAADHKSTHWLRRATRNWLWLCARHAKGRDRILGPLAVLARALAHAGPRPTRWWPVLQGLAEGLRLPAPPVPPGITITGAPFRTLMRVRLRPPAHQTPAHQPPASPPSPASHATPHIDTPARADRAPLESATASTR